MEVARIRQLRVAEQIKKETSDILRQLKDPRVGFVSVVSVEVSGDLRHAKIYVSVLGGEAERQATMAALERARGYVRTELARRIRLRFAPEIQFLMDESIEHGARIAQLLRHLGTAGAAKAGGQDAES